MPKAKKAAAAGLPGDPEIFKVLTEISIIANLADREFERLMPGGLTLAQFGVLNHLLHLNVQQTISEIASAMQVAQPTMSSTVKKLHGKDYVAFVAEPRDLRVKRVAVTKAGRKAREAAVAAVAPGIERLAAATPKTDWPRMLEALTELRVLLDAAR